MRTPLIAANWKMNKTVTEAIQLVSDLTPALSTIKGVEKVLCPSFMALFPVADLLKGTDISLGAQNMNWEAKGAFTGEVSPGMVAECCKYVIIGHSERRTYFSETDTLVNKKIIAAQAVGLIPIVCVGENEAVFKSGCTAEVITNQVREGLKGLETEFVRKIVIAYEPVWAIGTGRASSGENAEAVIRDHIRQALAEMYDQNTAMAVRVLYGGSVTAMNASEYFGQTDIDGALVGGASLITKDFIEIVRAAAK